MTVCLAMMGQLPSAGPWDSPGLSVWGREMSNSGHDHLAVCEVVKCQISMYGVCLGGTVTNQVVCLFVTMTPSIEDVCVTAGDPFHFLIL